MPKAGITTCLALLILASTIAHAQPLAGANRPAGVPEQYVITPFGYFHPSCVLRLAQGETLIEDGRIIRHADGSTASIAACEYPTYTAHGEILNQGPLEIGHSYIEWAGATTISSYGRLAATWTVPPAPASNDGQTIFFFPGLDDINDVISILQPVLGWNDDFPAAWGLASWNCCPNGITVESPPVHVSSGDQIKGTIWETCAAGTVSCPTWNVASEDVTTAQNTTLNGTPSEGQTFNWAFAGALEVYNVLRCSDYPPNGSLTFSNVALEDNNFKRISNPGWSITEEAIGLTPQCGYAGQVAPTQATLDYSPFVTLVSFNITDGNSPSAALMQATDGHLYGTTRAGGAYNFGTVFKTTTSGMLTTVYSFCSQLLCPDGNYPTAALMQATNGHLYGITPFGGASGAGTVFEITLTGTLTTLHSFCSQANCADGNQSEAPLMQATNGYLYGTTFGNNLSATVFKITPSGTLTTAYTFCSQANCADGNEPEAALMQATNGYLYGTTLAGGANGSGTVFKITPTGQLTTLYSFCSQANCVDGEQPYAALIQATDGYLYGTTMTGGTNGSGTVFKIAPNGGPTILHSFCVQANCADGMYPYAPLIQATDGNLYGTTANGGSGLAGTVFKITSNGQLTTLYGFCYQEPNCPDGEGPQAALIQATDGNLYGTTSGGGAVGFGTVFRLSVGLGPFVKTLPTSGKVGTPVKILGTNLTGATSVTFNGTAATFTVASASEITTTVPIGAATGKIQLVTPSGTLSSNVPFKVQP